MNIINTFLVEIILVIFIILNIFLSLLIRNNTYKLSKILTQFCLVISTICLFISQITPYQLIFKFLILISAFLIINSDNELTSLNWDFDESTKQDWGFESKDDSWGISVTDKEPDDTTSETEGGEWVYVDEYGNEYPADDDSDGYPQNNNDNQDWEWDYVEEINGNTCAYSSDSYDKKLSMNEISPIYKGSSIQMTTVPQIHDETNDDEMNDPYKNSILKD